MNRVRVAWYWALRTLVALGAGLATAGLFLVLSTFQSSRPSTDLSWLGFTSFVLLFALCGYVFGYVQSPGLQAAFGHEARVEWSKQSSAGAAVGLLALTVSMSPGVGFPRLIVSAFIAVASVPLAQSLALRKMGLKGGWWAVTGLGATLAGIAFAIFLSYCLGPRVPDYMAVISSILAGMLLFGFLTGLQMAVLIPQRKMMGFAGTTMFWEIG